MGCSLDNLILEDVYVLAPSARARTIKSGSEHTLFGYWVILTILTKVKFKNHIM